MRKVIVLVCAVAMTAPSLAQARQLRIENRRAVALTELTITTKDGAAPQTFVLASDIAAGQSAMRNVPPRLCLFDVKGTFADQSTLAADDMDLCSQRTIRLVQ